MTEINNISQLPTTGKIVLVILNGLRAPCRKFLGEMNQAIEIVETNPTGASYFNIQLNTEIKEFFHITQIPVAIVMVDGVEKTRFSGHWTYHFEMADKIRGGFST